MEELQKVLNFFKILLIKWGFLVIKFTENENKCFISVSRGKGHDNISLMKNVSLVLKKM